MKAQQYLDQIKKYYDSIIQYISNESEDDCIEVTLLNNILKFQITNNKERFRESLLIIAKISENYHRTPALISKIENILLNYVTQIKQTFTKTEIIDIFHDKRIILFLFKQNIIMPDIDTINIVEIKIIPREIYKDDTIRYVYYQNDCIYNNTYFFNVLEYSKVYFIPEMKNCEEYQNYVKMIEGELAKIGINDETIFEEKRMNGVNDSILCEMIREDSVQSFISHVNRYNISLTRTLIPRSFLETNSFLIDKTPTLIEYAAFYGSIQIFQYLQINGAKLEPDLWLYAIHGKNADIIHFLESNEVKPPSDDYETCLKESIKCHHNDIAQYIYDNLIENGKEENFANNIYSYCFQYMNYHFINDNIFSHKYVLHYLCKYRYYNLVKLYLINEEIDVNAAVDVFKKINFYNIFNCHLNDISIN